MIISYEDLDRLFKFMDDYYEYRKYRRNYCQKDIATRKFKEKIPYTFSEMFGYDYIVHENGKLEFIDKQNINV